MKTIRIVGFGWLFACVGTVLAGGLTAGHLRCEYLENPLGIDVAAPRLSWTLTSDERGQKQTAYRVLVASSQEKLAADAGDLWDSGKVVSAKTLQVVYGGRTLASRQSCYWKVQVWDKTGQLSPWSAATLWSMGLLCPADWGGAKWIAFRAPKVSVSPRLGFPTNTFTTPPATMFRKGFVIDGGIRHATVSVTGLGLYELRINGRRVGDHLLAPGWTRFSRRIQYQTYDVTSLLRKGANAVGAQVCGGWWSGPLVTMPAMPLPQYCLLLRMDINRTDGTHQTVVSDGAWQATDEGPIRQAGIYDGEIYDATKEQPGWDAPGFSANGGWIAAQVLDHPTDAADAVLSAQPNEPIRVEKELTPVKITQPKPGVYVFDMGQNMVGWCRLKTDAPTGAKITLRFGEMLNDDGTVYFANLRSAKQTNEYTWLGGEKTVEPHFTYFGFRYVQVTGLTKAPDAGTLTGRVFHSAAPEAGTFSCSSDLLNAIMHNIAWTQRANMMSVPTDCPQRDERLGWTGDAQSFSQTAIFNRDMAAFFTKWIFDLRDSQADDGRYPDFAPHLGDPNAGHRGGAAWGDAGAIVPWRMYQNYADTRVLEQHFDSAKRWIEFLHRKYPDLLCQKHRTSDYGDWLNGDTLILDGYPRGISAVPKEIFATAFFAHSTEIVAKMATVLGRAEDAAAYGALFQAIKAAFNKAYVSDDGRIRGDTQAGYALALHFNLLPDVLRSKAAAHLMAAIHAYKDHPSSGIHATHRMLIELSENGQHDEACRIINLRTVPSWGYMVDQGATTIWERWDGYVKGRGFQTPDMNSFNHWALGSVGEWVWRELVGIHPDEAQPGFKHVVIHPRPGGGLTWMKGRYVSIRGPIVSEWSQNGDAFSLHVAIPPNTTATVFVPSKVAANVTESGMPAARAKGVSFLRMQDGSAVFAVESGDYTFASAM